MEIILNRIAKRKSYTIGKLYIENEKFFDEQSGKAERKIENGPAEKEGGSNNLQYLCDTLEPTWRDYAHGAHKIKGCSAIPEGRYAVVITWSPRFKQWLPLLIGDQIFNKQWQGIRIHAGNTSCDTEGCILVGENKKVGQVLNSRIWLHRLKQKIVEAKDRGEPVWITVKD